MSKKLLITELRHLVKNPPPTAKSLLSEEEFDYLLTICPNWEVAEENKLAVLLFPPEELQLVNRIIDKLKPLEMTIAKVRTVDAEKRSLYPGSVSTDAAEELKKLMRNNNHA